MTTTTVVNEEAILATGRNIAWTRQDAATSLGVPSSATSGVPVANPVSVYLAVSLRETVHHRSVRVATATLDATATYTVSIDGTPANKATPTDENDLLTGLRDAINAAASATVSAAALDADGIDVTTSSAPATSLVITGQGFADYSVAISATGAGVLTAIADGSSATGSLFLKPRGAAASSADAVPGWLGVAGGQAISLPAQGYLERINAAGASRLFLQLDGVSGHGSDSGITYRTPDVDFGVAVAS